MANNEHPSWWKYVLSSSWAGVIGYPLSNAVILIFAFILYLLFKLIEKLFPDTYNYIDRRVSDIYDLVYLWTNSNPEIALVVIMVSCVVWLWYSHRQRGKKTKQLELRERKEADLIRSFGAYHYSDRVSEDDKREDWEKFLRLVKSEKHTSTLRILGASGYETFGHESSPLHDLVKNFRGEVKVLILDAKAEAIKDRVQNLPNDANVTSYRLDAKKSFNFIKGLEKWSNSRIKIRTYNHMPSWKMVLTDQHLWLQYYVPSCHVTDSSVHIIYRNNEAASLFNCFMYEFYRLWEEAKHNSD